MDVSAAWDVVERVLAERAPRVAATLRGPASFEGIDRLRATVGRELPDDVVASLRRHDGQDNPTRLLDLFDHHTLLGVDEMIGTSDMRAGIFEGRDGETSIEWMVPDKVRTVMNCRGWLQFTDVEGRGYALDLDPLPAGDVGQIISLPIDGPTPEPEFPSFTAWFSDIAERLDAGAFRVEDGDGIWLDRPDD